MKFQRSALDELEYSWWSLWKSAVNNLPVAVMLCYTASVYWWSAWNWLILRSVYPSYCCGQPYTKVTFHSFNIFFKLRWRVLKGSKQQKHLLCDRICPLNHSVWLYERLKRAAYTFCMFGWLVHQSGKPAARVWTGCGPGNGTGMWERLGL